MAQISVPDIGDFHDVEVIDVLVKPGDKIEVDSPLLTLETEKATMDVPSTAAGVVKSIAVKKGDRVSKGTVIVEVEAAPSPQPSPARGEGARTADAEKSTAESAAAPKGATGGAADTSSSGVGTSRSAVPSAADSPSTAAAATPDVAAAATPSTAAAATPSTAAEATPSTAAAAASRAAAGVKPSSAPSPLAGEGRGEGPARSAVLPPIDEAGFSRAYASPSVRKFARELGVDLTRVSGSGPKGRIKPEDVKGWVKQTLARGAGAAAGSAALPKIPEIDFAKFGAVEVKPLGRIQKISGPRLHASWVNVPHVWQMDEADITELEEARNKLKGEASKQGIKLTPLAFILRACVIALQEFPSFNASLDSSGRNLVLKKYVHLGFAADTPNGLMVPVIRDAQRKDVYELARDLATLSEKARDGKLSVADMQGACFTVSSLGGIGGTSFTPIINAPEVAILGVARSAMKPVFQNGAFVPRLILPFTLAYDHRVIDGAAGVRFTTFLAQKLADVKSVLEAVP